MNNTAINRVPHILFIYWVIKIASTTLGETGADMFSMTFDYGYETTIAIFTGLFALLLGIKLLIKRYDPTIYWLVFTATAIVGTAFSDYIDRTLGLGYAAGSVILTFALILILALWKRAENSINVEYIVTAKAETYYWLAFLIANTLGTAAGDFLADDMELGFAVSAAIITGLLIFITLLHYYTKMSKTVLFWLAFVLTRPFGATFGDFLTKPVESGGLNLGTIGASIFFAVVLVISIHKETRLEKSRTV
jgi:uncharacterized membrane-anchored protein